MRWLLRALQRYAALLVHGVDPVYTFSIEFVTGSFTNLSSHFERGNWGSSVVDMINAPRAGFGLFQLNNAPGSLSPRYNTNLKPGKAVKLTATHGGSSSPLFFGRIRDVTLSSRLGERTTLLECVDDWDRVKDLTYTTPIMANTQVRSLFTALMSQSRVNSFSVDPITDVVPFAWYRDRDAPNALHELVQTGNYQIVVDGNGTYYLRDRYWSVFLTGVATYVLEGEERRFSLTKDSVINRMKMNARVRNVTTEPLTVAAISGPITIPASSHINLWLTYQDPATFDTDTPVSSQITPIASEHYYGSANPDGGGTDRTSQLSLSFTGFAASAVASFFNGGGTEVYLSRFHVFGYPIREASQIGAQFDVSSSQDVFGVRNLTIDNALIPNHSFLSGMCKVVVTDRKDGRDSLAGTFVNEFPQNIRFIPGDLISVVDSFSGYVRQWRVRSVDHEIELANGLMHLTKYDMEAFETEDWLVLDHATFGQLTNGRMLAI